LLHEKIIVTPMC